VNVYRPPSTRRGFRLAALVAAVICVLAIAAGAFVLSYTGARDLALTAGVTTDLARVYPWIFDAVLVVAAMAALSLRGAMRGYAWLVILIIIGAIASADVIHATATSLPKHPTEATIAAAPWAVLLLGFTLLYAMVRQVLPSRKAAAAAAAAYAANGSSAAEQTLPVRTPVPLSELLGDRAGTRPERAEAAQAARATATAVKTKPAKTKPAKTEPAVDAEPAVAPSSAAQADPAPATTAEPAAKIDPVSSPEPEAKPEPLIAPWRPPVTATRPAPLPSQRPAVRDDPSDADAEPAEPAAHFNRLRSSPTPPTD
jgi:Protein of unknown function (DUF2637)